MLVGVPDDIKRYFSMTPNFLTVSNRLHEIPEVARLTEDQARQLVLRGLQQELGYRIDKEDIEILVHHIAWVTDRIPQQVHEYCLELARIAEVNGGVIALDELQQADQAWMSASLTGNYTVIENQMNARATTVGRRNQVLYALGRCTRENFRHTDVDRIVRKEFPGSTKSTNLNVGQLLSELASADPPMIKRTPKGDGYRFVNPKYRMCLRTMLKKGNRELVEVIEQRHLSVESSEEAWDRGDPDLNSETGQG